MRLLHVIILLSGILLICSNFATAQYVDTTWTKIYWNGYFDSVNCIQETRDSGFIMVGTSMDNVDYKHDINLIKTDRDGVVEWEKLIGTDSTDETGYHVLETLDGGYLIGAQSDAHMGGPGEYGIWIVKTDSLGDTMWTHPVTDPDGNGWPIWATQTFDSGYAITGIINVDYDNHAFIMEFDKNGGYLGTVLYGDYRFHDGWYIHQMPDSGYIVAGNHDDPYSSGYDYWVFRTNKYRTLLWDSLYVLTDYHDEMHAACAVDDGLVMAGLARGEGHVHKVDFDGNTIWSKSITLNPINERNNAICPTDDGGFMVGGWVNVPGYRRKHNFIRLNSLGDILWTFNVGGWQDDHGRSVVATYDGGFALVGTSNSFVNGSSFYLTKIKRLPCGDANGDGSVNIGDAVFLINYIFNSGAAPEPLCLGDVNGDGVVNIGDPVYMVNYIFRFGPPPIEPSCP